MWLQNLKEHASSVFKAVFYPLTDHSYRYRMLVSESGIITGTILCGYMPFRSADMEEPVRQMTEAETNFHDRCETPHPTEVRPWVVNNNL